MEKDKKVQKYVVVSEEQEIYEQELSEEDMQGLLGSGWISGIIRIHDGGVEYADPDHETGVVTWKKPILKK